MEVIKSAALGLECAPFFISSPLSFALSLSLSFSCPGDGSAGGWRGVEGAAPAVVDDLIKSSRRFN